MLLLLLVIICSSGSVRAYDQVDIQDQSPVEVSDWVVVSDWDGKQLLEQPGKSLEQPEKEKRVGFFDVNANYAQGLSFMVLFIFAFWLAVDFLLGDVNILKMLGVTPLAIRGIRRLAEDYDAEQVTDKTEEVMNAINTVKENYFPSSL